MTLLSPITENEIRRRDDAYKQIITEKLLTGIKNDERAKFLSDGSFDYYGNFNVCKYIDINSCIINQLPFTMNKVFGNCVLNRLKLSSTIGFPKEVHGTLDVNYNHIKTFDGCPTKLVYFLKVDGNELTNLCNIPTIKCEVESSMPWLHRDVGTLNCAFNNLENLDGIQSTLNTLDIRGNKELKYLKLPSANRITINKKLIAYDIIIAPFETTGLPMFEMIDAFDVNPNLITYSKCDYPRIPINSSDALLDKDINYWLMDEINRFGGSFVSKEEREDWNKKLTQIFNDAWVINHGMRSSKKLIVKTQSPEKIINGVRILLMELRQKKSKFREMNMEEILYNKMKENLNLISISNDFIQQPA